MFEAPGARYGGPGDMATILKLRSARAEALASAILGDHFPEGHYCPIIDIVVGDPEEFLHDSDVFKDVCYSQLQSDQYLSEGRQKFAALYQAALDIWNNDLAAREQALAIVRARCEGAVRIAKEEEQ